jgi:geranylgeranyl diphosphate synthase type I
MMFAQFMQTYLPEIDAAMRQVVDGFSGLPDDFGVMLRYPFGWVDEHNQPYNQPTGKRIRPILLLLCTGAAGGDWRVALPAAAAVEILHNFSLIHDDIQDNSPTRHGRATVWKIWGQANAINAGDALFCLAYTALESLSISGVSSETSVKVWHIFNKMTAELTRGQHLDMRFEHQNMVAVDEYISMISGKSAALVSACSQIGALIATNDDELSSRYGNFGINLGIAFQIRDDILGIWGEPEVTGKSVATDILSRKKSLPVLYGLTQNQRLVEIYQNEALTNSNVTEAVALLDELGARNYAQEIELRFYQEAIASLEAANPQGEAANWLMHLVDSLFQREY